MDGDGDLDIVSASRNDDTIAWYENDGAANPSWTAADIATSAEGAYDVHVADMDGDGDLDIVSASLYDDTIAWYENDGAANPSWAAADIATSADGAWDVHVADMDGDGDLDIVSASFVDNTIAWYENDGNANPSWTAANIATSAAGARGVHVADMDGDGDLDIVSAFGNTIAWYENDGAANPSWTAANIATSANGAFDVHVADMDGDGDLDIVSASAEDDTIAWYENNGASDPSWTAADIATSADGAYDVHIADMDGDGDLDIVSASRIDDTIAWYENDGAANPTWSAADIATSADYATDVHVADMDGDGDLDIVSASFWDDTIAWYESNAADVNLDTDATAGADYTAVSGTLTFAAGDTTKTFTVPVLADTYPENNETATLTLSSASNATISDATGILTITDDDSISFTAADITTSANGANDVVVADIDGDGDLDIVSASGGDSTIAWYENDGAANPGWTTRVVSTTPYGAHTVYVADMDSDGDLDIVSASLHDDTIAWYENNGAADPSWTAANIDTNADWAMDVHIADMDGDGDLDIVSASRNDDTIAWYENNGAANPSWTAANIATSADGVDSAFVADMDGDGDLDIVSASGLDDTIAWYENDGNANPSWTAADIATNADGARDVYVADMDGDGDLDIISTSLYDNTIAWYENDGAADPSWTAQDISTNAGTPIQLEAADVDGDGDMDILTASWDDSVSWWENNGAANPTWTEVAVSDDIVGRRGVTSGDLDGDGDLDIVSAGFQNDTIAWYENNCDGNDPIVLDLDGNGIALLGLAADVLFDVDADGVLETTGWAGPGDGILVMDLDDSGYIEDMSEVFSEVFNGQQHAGSLAALASLDDNEDQRIDATDTAFENILVWRDANSDGISAGTELSTLTERGIRSIDLTAEPASDTIAGNRVEATGRFGFDDGTTGKFAEVTFAAPRFTLAGVIGTQGQQDDAGNLADGSFAVAPVNPPVNGGNGRLADSVGPEIFDYVATTADGVASGNQATFRTGPGGDTIEAFANATSATSTALTVNSSSSLVESPDTPDFNPEALPENYMLLTDIETASTALM